MPSLFKQLYYTTLRIRWLCEIAHDPRSAGESLSGAISQIKPIKRKLLVAGRQTQAFRNTVLRTLSSRFSGFL